MPRKSTGMQNTTLIYLYGRTNDISISAWLKIIAIFFYNFRDPRQKRLQKAEDEKADKNKRDGAKLSFQEKMKLFAVEAGEKTPNRDKAKISRAQRELEDEESSSEYHGHEPYNE